MITFKSTRDKVRLVHSVFFQYINLYKQTRMNNIAHCHTLSEEYLTALTINCLLSEIETLLQKKLVNTSSNTIKLSFTNAQGVLLYKTFLAMPLPNEGEKDIYNQMVRNEWLTLLDAAIIKEKIQQQQPKAHAPAGKFSYLGEEW